ncbi:MAG: energy transducer TonB [Candidatus Methylacidiphilales bacterium]
MAQKKDEILIEAEVSPEYIGGEAAMSRFISYNFDYPEFCNKNNIGGKAVIKFSVASSGYVDSAFILESPHPLISEEYIRVVKSMPRWIPGRQAGRPVAVYYTLPMVCTPEKSFDDEPQYTLANTPKPIKIAPEISESERKLNSIKQFVAQTNDEFYNYEIFGNTHNNMFADQDKIRTLSSNEFLSSHKIYFTNKKRQIDSIKNIMNNSNSCLNDSAINESLNKFELYIARELRCIERFQNLGGFWRSSVQFHPIYNNWYMNDAYTKKYDSDYLNKKVNFILFFDLPSLNFTSGNLTKVGFNHFNNLSIGLGFCYKKFTFKVYGGFTAGTNPSYQVTYNDSIVNANQSSSGVIGFETNFKYHHNKKWSCFINGGMGYSKLNQYWLEELKEKNKTVVSNTSPVFKLGHTISYRLNPLFYFTFNTNVSYLNHQSNVGTDLSGLLYQVGFGFGIWGNKNW